MLLSALDSNGFRLNQLVHSLLWKNTRIDPRISSNYVKKRIIRF